MIVTKLDSLLQNKAFDNVLVVYDSAAFGHQYSELINYLNGVVNKYIQILDWPSFEHYILSEPPFNEIITQEEIGCSYESLEQAATQRIQQLIPYSKHKLTKCLLLTSNYKKCDRVTECPFKHGNLKTCLFGDFIIGFTYFYYTWHKSI